MQKNKNMIEIYKDYNSEEYNNIAMALIWQQQQFNPKLNENYVVRGSILSCIKGTKKIKLDILNDKGVYSSDNAVCTIDDCKVGENIHSFCTCHTYHENYGYRCVPEPVEEWNQESGSVMAYSQDAQEYVDILRNSAILACGREGYITIEEVPVSLSAEPSEPACYETHREAFQYKNRDLLYTYIKSELEHFVECMDENLIIYDEKSKKYVFDMKKYYENKKWSDPSSDDSNDFAKLYFFFKAEIILRKYDLIMENHYKNWLINGTTVDVSKDYNNLFKENTELIKSIRAKFLSEDEITNKKTAFFTDMFFKDLVNTKKIWDIKLRVVVMNFSVDNIQLAVIKKRIGEDAFNDAVRGKVEYDEKNKVYKFTFVVEPYGKNSYMFNGALRKRDYYGNYNFGYVGFEYYYYRMEEKALDHILFWSDIAQRASNKNPFVGDPKEDIDAMKDGANAWKRDNNIVSE